VRLELWQVVASTAHPIEASRCSFAPTMRWRLEAIAFQIHTTTFNVFFMGKC